MFVTSAVTGPGFGFTSIASMRSCSAINMTDVLWKMSAVESTLGMREHPKGTSLKADEFVFPFILDIKR